MEEEVKQTILVRNDLDMGKGKMAAQVAHASIMSYLEAVKTKLRELHLFLR